MEGRALCSARRSPRGPTRGYASGQLTHRKHGKTKRRVESETLASAQCHDSLRRTSSRNHWPLHSAISCHALGQASSNAKHATQPSLETLHQAQSQKGSEPLAIAQCHDPLQLSSTRHHQRATTFKHTPSPTRRNLYTNTKPATISPRAKQEHSPCVATYGQRTQRQRRQRRPTISPKRE